MSLLDHFHPPLSERRSWHAFYNSWATYLSAQINERLSPGYFAEANVLYGIEVDVAGFAEDGSAVAEAGWAQPPPARHVPVTSSGGVVEVGIFSRSGGPALAGAIELVSPGNKDREGTREAFVSKCATYIQAGVGLVIVDVVTERRADLHRELLIRLRVPGGEERGLYAAAYRPVKAGDQTALEVWHEELAVGRALPTMPLWMRGGLCLPVALQSAYERTCREQRVLPAA
jgi:hypothetical protein